MQDVNLDENTRRASSSTPGKAMNRLDCSLAYPADLVTAMVDGTASTVHNNCPIRLSNTASMEYYDQSSERSTGVAMKFMPKRFLEEFFLYSSQFVLFYIIILFASPVAIRPSVLALLTLTSFLLMQIALLARYGHRSMLRFLFSLMTPFGYSVMQAFSGPVLPLDMASFFLWATALYLGGIQAVALMFRRKWLKRTAETFLTVGTVFTFIFFYFYLNLRIVSIQAYEAGQLDYAGLIQALSMSNLVPAFMAFARPLQHIFFMFGALMFGLFQVSDKIKQISLKTRLDAVYAVVAPPSIQEADRINIIKGERREVTILYADLWNFTPLAEKEGPTATFGLLTRYYALWDIVVRRNKGIIDQFVGDSVIAVFGMMGEKDACDNAVACALDFFKEFPYLQEDLADRRLPLVKHIGIGIHAGKVSAGELSTASGQGRIAIIGEAINMAARLDSLCREYKQDMLISQSVYKQLGLESQAHFVQIGEVLFRGNTQPQLVYGRK
jgi:adenylate cyclase